MFLVCGEALWDLFPSSGRAGMAFDAQIGGSPFNVAVGLARLGQPSALFTELSTDRLGGALRAALEAEGVATRFLVRSDRLSILSLIDLAADGSATYTFYGIDHGRSAKADLALPALDAGVWGVHVGSFALVVEPTGTALLELAAREAGRRLITFDPNVRLNVVPDRDLWRARVEAAVRSSDVVKASSEDLGLLYPGATGADIAARWRAAGAGLVIVTRGPDGAEAFSATGRVELPGRRVDVTDTTGAGDSFQAALIAGLAERRITGRRQLDALDADTITAMVGFAIDAAAITCSRRGADLPRRDVVAVAAAKNR